MARERQERGSHGAGAWNGLERAELDEIQTVNVTVFRALNCRGTGLFALPKKHILETGI